MHVFLFSGGCRTPPTHGGGTPSLIEKEHAIVGQRDFAGHRHLPAPDQPLIRDGVVGGATRPGRDERGAGAGEAGDAMDAGGFDGFGEGQSGRMVVSRRASIDFPAPRGPRRST